jgi:hypothetical protein
LEIVQVRRDPSLRTMKPPLRVPINSVIGPVAALEMERSLV